MEVTTPRKLYDILHLLYRQTFDWEKSTAVSKEDVISDVRSSIALCIGQLLASPTSGTLLIYPGDSLTIDNRRSNLDENKIYYSHTQAEILYNDDDELQ